MKTLVSDYNATHRKPLRVVRAAEGAAIYFTLPRPEALK